MRKFIKGIPISFVIFNIILFNIAAYEPACDNIDWNSRAVKILKAVPSGVKVVVPNLDPFISTSMESAISLFELFYGNNNLTNYQKAMEGWRIAKNQLLSKYSNNQTVGRIVAGVDIVLSQVDIPANDGGDSNTIIVKIKIREDGKRAIRELESLLSKQ